MALDFSRNYLPPGVYIEESESTLVTSVGIPPTLVALVGPARGYQTNTEQIVLDSEEGVTLAKQGIDLTSASVVVAETGAVVPEADYAVTKVGTANDQTYYSDFTAVSEGSVAEGTTVFVTYQYTDPGYFNPRRFENFEDVKDVFGEPLNTVVTSPGDPDYEYVTSALSLAAMVAMQNGATDLVLCAATPPDSGATTESAKSSARRTALSEGCDKVRTDPSVNVIVAVTTGISEDDVAGTLADFRGSITASASDGFFRFGVIGFEPDMEDGPDVLLGTSGATDKRLMLAYAAPSGLQMYSGPGNSSFAVGHQYLAAAYAGRMAALPVQQSLTKQVIAGFSGLAGTPLSNSLKNQYSAGGIAVAEVDRFGRLSVRHGVTTDPTNVNTREAAVVRARDALVVALNEGTSTSGLIGAPIDEDLLLSVKSAVQGILENALADEVIVEYIGLAVRQLSTDPSVVEVKFAYRPAYPLNYIVISFSIDMSTGTTDLTTDETQV